MKICLDAVPATSRKAKKNEGDKTFEFCKKLSEALQAQDITVVITRDENEKLTPRQRIRYANESAADFVLSVDVGSMAEVWVPSTSGPLSFVNGQALMDALLEVLPEQAGRYATQVHKGYPDNPSGD